MAHISYQDKAFHVSGLLCFLLLIHKNTAFELPVGGNIGWTVPDNTSSEGYYMEWAERTRFQIGDSLLFTYDSSKDSVLQVTREDYENCSTTSPIALFNKSRTVFELNKSGPYYFISGNEANCHRNEKLVVVVLAGRTGNRSANTSQAPSTSLPSPGSPDMVPAPTPSGEEFPPPPAETRGPTPPPTAPNSASSMFVSVIGSLGAFFTSSLVLAIF